MYPLATVLTSNFGILLTAAVRVCDEVIRKSNVEVYISAILGLAVSDTDAAGVTRVLPAQSRSGAVAKCISLGSMYIRP